MGKKICFVLESGYQAFDQEADRIGGMEVQFKTVPEKLASLGHEIYILASKIIEHPSITFIGVQKIFRNLKELSPDLVITTIATKTALKTALACKVLGLRFVYWVPHDEESELKIGRGSKGNPLGRMLFVSMLRFATYKIITQNSTQNNNLAKRGFGSKLVLFRNAYPIPEKIPGPEEKKTILWVSRFVEWKRPEIFVELARKLPHRTFVMISPGVTEKFKQGCKDVKNLEIIDFVPYSEIATYYAQARVYVSTSRFEGFPNAFQNAACQGTPIISMNVDPDNLFDKFGHGVLIDDLTEMAKQIDEMFTDKVLYKRLYDNARRYVSLVHDIEETTEKLLVSLLED